MTRTSETTDDAAYPERRPDGAHTTAEAVVARPSRWAGRVRRPTHRPWANPPPTERAPTHRWNDRGSSILEFAGFLPILLLVGMAAIQLGLIGYGISQAGSAARAAARAESLQPGTGQAAGIAAASGWLNPAPAVAPGADTTTATVTVTVPSVVPLFDPVTVERSATMPNDLDP